MMRLRRRTCGICFFALRVPCITCKIVSLSVPDYKMYLNKTFFKTEDLNKNIVKILGPILLDNPWIALHTRKFETYFKNIRFCRKYQSRRKRLKNELNCIYQISVYTLYTWYEDKSWYPVQTNFRTSKNSSNILNLFCLFNN